jgi:short chain dehydrogenase
MDKLAKDKLVFLAGQVAIVTGAGGGIGAAIARSLGELSATVVLCGRTPAALESTAKVITEVGGKAEVIACDVTSLESVEAAAKRFESSFGRLDILVNNAGIGGFGGPLHQLPPDAWDKILNTNLRGVYYAIRAPGSHDDSCPIRPYHQHFIDRGKECTAQWGGLRSFQMGTERVELFRGGRVARS